MVVLVLKIVSSIECLKHIRQPGSAFKPFVYALALENKYTPSSLILDAPLVLDQGIDLKKMET